MMDERNCEQVLKEKKEESIEWQRE